MKAVADRRPRTGVRRSIQPLSLNPLEWSAAILLPLVFLHPSIREEERRREEHGAEASHTPPCGPPSNSRRGNTVRAVRPPRVNGIATAADTPLPVRCLPGPTKQKAPSCASLSLSFFLLSSLSLFPRLIFFFFFFYFFHFLFFLLLFLSPPQVRVNASSRTFFQASIQGQRRSKK